MVHMIVRVASTTILVIIALTGWLKVRAVFDRLARHILDNVCARAIGHIVANIFLTHALVGFIPKPFGLGAYN